MTKNRSKSFFYSDRTFWFKSLVMIQLWWSNGFIKKFLDWIKVNKSGFENLCEYLQAGCLVSIEFHPNLNMKSNSWKEFFERYRLPSNFSHRRSYWQCQFGISRDGRLIGSNNSKLITFIMRAAHQAAGDPNVEARCSLSRVLRDWEMLMSNLIAIDRIRGVHPKAFEGIKLISNWFQTGAWPL